ncbi:MAG: hypothetical protein IPL16_06090 [Ignavibacteria bacterium]|nr:hypothetical protein [Ignavibacteria bacterium]
MKTFIITLSLFLVTSAFSQSINNTLGTGGVFRIKDASANFFTLSQSTGEVNILNSLRLENTVSPTIGVMYKGSNRFYITLETGILFRNQFRKFYNDNFGI